MLDTRDLEERRNSLKEEIFKEFISVFGEYENDYSDFDDIDFDDEEFKEFKEIWEEDFEKIQDINDLEDEIGSEWKYGVLLIPEDEFSDYCIDLIKDIGDLPDNIPAYIENNIDWEGVADDLRTDYSETTFNNEIYLYRA